MRRSAVLMVLIFFIGLLPAAAQEIPLTLDEALSIAMRDNRDVLLKTEDVRRAKAQIAESNAALLPSLNFTASLTDTRGLYSKDLTQTTAQATLKQYIYKGAKTINTIEQGKHKKEVTQALLDKTKLELGLSVYKAFYTLLLSQDLSTLNKDIVDNTQGHLSSIKERYKNGEVSESEVLNMENSLAVVKQASESSVNQAEAAGSLLNNLLYLDKDAKIKPAVQFNYLASDIAYDQAFLKSMQARPEIKQYEAQLKADKRAVQIAKADTRPSIYASWDYYSRSHASSSTNRNWNDYNVIGLVFSWPIFDGWATRSKVEQALADLKETELTEQKVRGDIALELKEAYLSLKDAIAKLQASETDLKVYADNLSGAREKYNQGIISLLGMNDANLKYEISAFNRKQAIYDYMLAKASFDKATGGF
ncbi:MAG: TolC family protein [Candidatus Omnitrophica bacterium]|nr:TolC family protein [Candidatus Omnitrophota bacterium]